jgi:hypothetical protein
MDLTKYDKDYLPYLCLVGKSNCCIDDSNYKGYVNIFGEYLEILEQQLNKNTKLKEAIEDYPTQMILNAITNKIQAEFSLILDDGLIKQILAKEDVNCTIWSKLDNNTNISFKYSKCEDKDKGYYLEIKSEDNLGSWLKLKLNDRKNYISYTAEYSQSIFSNDDYNMHNS